MLDISPLVYSRLINDEVMKKHLGGHSTTRKERPPTFPYLYMKVLGQPTTSSSLQNKQCSIQASFEITIYDSDSSTKAKQLIFHAADLMQEMGFTMNYGPVEIERASNTEAYRWNARFRRTYCEGDLI